MTCEVLLVVKTKPDCMDKVRDWFRSILPDTRGFAGFVSLHIAQNQDDPTELVIVEQRIRAEPMRSILAGELSAATWKPSGAW
jgi:16S rRNA C967 or C1407 C5-methylase (RsmB/RsmF family)